MNIHGYKQVEVNHYITDSIAAPIANPSTVRILLILPAMHPKWISELIDVE